jgi:eukaryotic-like serine/threonine-protein kinase
MGEVYRAKDTRLNRHVALKILAPELAADATALLRFEREAQALAALSHPGIVTIYDVGRHDNSAYVVMELLEGETLRARLEARPIGLRKALNYAIQAAHALAAAHERGIVHRDLKPENLFICHDGRIKILDFGIARLAADATATFETMVPESTGTTTAAGRILGSLSYMPPEQMRGQPVDARGDIFALGAVIYEMVSGTRAFGGDTGADIIAALLNSEPRELDPAWGVPPALERVVRRCLEKQPAERFQSARDVAFALDAVSSGAGTADIEPPSLARRVPWWVAALTALVAAGIGVGLERLFRPSAPAVQSRAVQFTFDANRGQLPEISVSPDGQYLAWTEITRGGRRGGVWVRRLDDAQPTLLGDTPLAGPLFWSADSHELVVLDEQNRLIAFDVDRGDRRVIVELEPDALPLRGGDWFAGTFLLGTGATIAVQDPTGQTPRRQVTTLVQSRESWHGWPTILPDGRRFFYTVGLSAGGTETRIGSIDGDEPIRIALPPSTSRVCYDHRGFIVFGQNRSLLSQPIDVKTGRLEGSPIRLASDVFQFAATGWIAADASRNGVLAWRGPGVDEAQFELVDRAGRTLSVITQPDAYTNFDVSPDGTRIVTTRRRPADAGSALFLIDLSRNLTTPISEPTSGSAISDPTWSPDGRQIAYRRGDHLVVRNALGGDERILTDWPAYPDSWTRDGKYLAVGRPRYSDYQLWAFRMDGPREEVPLVQGVSLADEARFSPDGKWIAFHAAIQGSPEIFAVRFPATGERWQLSTGGGVQPRWRSDGRELFYLAPDGQVMSVAMPEGDPTRAQSPKPLFGLRFEPSPAFDQFAPMADGQRFVVRRPLRPGGTDTAPVHVLVNWTERVSGPSRATASAP